jgi:hypothetical protein
MDPREFLRKALVFEARRWVGIKEFGGANRGQVVEMFQRAVDGKAQGEPWCAGFTHFCLDMVDRQIAAILPAYELKHRIAKTEHVLTIWKDSPMICRRQTAAPGYLTLWWHFGPDGKPSGTGHVGIVTEVQAEDRILSVEGNTSDGTGINRDGDGVYERTRHIITGAGTMRHLGFLDPWAYSMLEDDQKSDDAA